MIIVFYIIVFIINEICCGITSLTQSMICDETQTDDEDFDKSQSLVNIYVDEKNSDGSSCPLKVDCKQEGLGIFRDPIEILGAKFQSTDMVYLCEMHMKQHAETIVDRRFTRNGTKTCMDVCCQYRCRMQKDESVDIKLTESYCGYGGDGADDETGASVLNLSTTCTCVYRVECNMRTKILLFHFEANCAGYLLVTSSAGKCDGSPPASVPVT